MAGGSYTVTLVATDDTGHTGTSTQTVDVASDAPKADFTFSPKAPGAGVNVNFNAGASIPAPGRTIVSYFWDFGGFVTSTSATPTITFPVGDWDVLLIVTDNAGKTGRVTKTVTVK
jgi:PKD repeat protein